MQVSMKCRVVDEGGGVVETSHERGSLGRGSAGQEVPRSECEGKVIAWGKTPKETKC